MITEIIGNSNVNIIHVERWRILNTYKIDYSEIRRNYTAVDSVLNKSLLNEDCNIGAEIIFLRRDVSASKDSRRSSFDFLLIALLNEPW